jgi:hypothetical protein
MHPDSGQDVTAIVKFVGGDNRLVRSCAATNVLGAWQHKSEVRS